MSHLGGLGPPQTSFFPRTRVMDPLFALATLRVSLLPVSTPGLRSLLILRQQLCNLGIGNCISKVQKILVVGESSVNQKRFREGDGPCGWRETDQSKICT